MVQKIVIEGELVSIYEETIARQIKLEQLMPYLVQKTPVTLPIIPKTAKWMHYDDATNPNRVDLYCLAELPPAIRTITKMNKRTGHSKRQYTLAFPWTYFWIQAGKEGGSRYFTIYNSKCFHAKEQFKADKYPGEFYSAFCPNLSNDGTICFGNTGGPIASIDEQIDYLVNSWYYSEFNDDLDGGFPFPFNTRNYRGWVDKTKANGLNVWKELPFETRNKYSIRDLLGLDTRITQIESVITIPEIPMPLTFGRAEEWLQGLTAQNRGRLKIALGNISDEDPTAVETPVEDVEVLDDGGVPTT